MFPFYFTKNIVCGIIYQYVNELVNILALSKDKANRP